MKDKTRIHNSSKRISSNPANHIIIFTFKYSPQCYNIALLKSGRFTLHRKFFLKDLLGQRKDPKEKRESMTIVNEIRNHGYIT